MSGKEGGEPAAKWQSIRHPSAGIMQTLRHAELVSASCQLVRPWNKFRV